jgi:Protein of unknown function (DUF1761)
MIYLTVFTCTILAIIIGSLWFGPIFGKRWMSLNNMILPEDPIAKKEALKKMAPVYVIQFLLSFFQIFILSIYIQAIPDFSGVEHAAILCAAFIIPTYAGSVMWSGDSRKVALEKFLLQAGAAIISMIVFGAVLGLNQ